MNKLFLFEKDYDLHFKDIYYEKKPSELSYVETYCSDGHIIFKPHHHYILTIWEYCDSIKITNIDIDIQFLSKLKVSGSFLYTIDDGLYFSVEYMNIGDLWTYNILVPMAKIKIHLK